MLEDSRTRDDVQALFDAVPPPSLGSDTLARADDLLRRLPDGDGAALLGATIDGYTLTGVLGRGGQATVYLAEDRAGQRFAFKVPHQSVLDRLIREAQILFHLDHPSVVRVERANVKGEVPYVVTEHCARGTLADLLRERGRLTVPEVHDLAIAILHALAYAHHKGVVHRDLKPSNVLFAADGKVKVADFGIGRLSLVEGRQIAGTLVSAEQTLFAGTPLYMAPEQIHHAADVDPRADLYAVGKLLYEALTGLAPRTIKPVSRLVPGLRPDWDEFLFTLVDEDPDARFASAKDALTALPWPDEVARPAPQRERTSEALDVEAKADELVQRASRAARARLGLFEAGDRVGEFVVLGPLGADGLVDRFSIARPDGPELRRLEVCRLQRMVDSHRAELFLEQSRLALALPKHPRLVQVLSVGEQGRPYRIVERPPGHVLQTGGLGAISSPADALRLVWQVTEGLEVLHEAGLRHGHLSPDAIRVTPAGDAVLDGIGLARDLEAETLGDGHASTSFSRYTPPEQMRQPLDARADLYCLGLIWYELLTGFHPLEAFSANEVMTGRAHDRIAPPTDIHPKLPPADCDLLMRLLAKDRDQRPADASDLLAALRALTPRPEPEPPQDDRGFWRKLADAVFPRRAPTPPVDYRQQLLGELALPRARRLRFDEHELGALNAMLEVFSSRFPARFALLVHAEGHPITSWREPPPQLNLETLAALAAASFAATREVAKLSGNPAFVTLTHEAPGHLVRTELVDREVLLLLLCDAELSPAAADACRDVAAELAGWFQEARQRRAPPAKGSGTDADARLDQVLDHLFGDV